MWVGLKSLTGLSLEDNKLTDIRTGTFDGLNSLQVLYLSSNKISSVSPGAFRSLGRLDRLILTTNELTEIRGDMWEGLDSLVSLKLVDNEITELKQGDLANLPKIWGVFLERNNITTVSNGLLDPELYPEGHPEDFIISLIDNPLQCDTRMYWMKQAEEEGWLETTGAFVGTLECLNPKMNWDQVQLHC